MLLSHYFKPILVSVMLITALLFSSCLIAGGLSNEEISSSYHKSYNYEQAGNINDAIKAIQLVYSQYPDTYTVNNRLGWLYTLNKQYQNARNHYQKAIFAIPSALSPKLGLLYVHILTHQYDKGSKLGYQIINIDYYNYYGNLRLAHILRKIKKYDLSKKILDKMLAIYPSDTLYLAELGLLYFDQKEWAKTIAVMNDVQILDPENVTAKEILFELKEK